MADPVLDRILGRAFEGVCTEMGSTMIQTATSAVFVEGRDFSCALLDPRAELVATANYDPSHLSAMAVTAEYALMELGHDDLADGDVIVVNDPYRGGGHLPDIAVLRPDLRRRDADRPGDEPRPPHRRRRHGGLRLPGQRPLDVPGGHPDPAREVVRGRRREAAASST